MDDSQTAAQSSTAETIQHTALIRIVRNVVDGQEPIGDIFTKVGQLAGGVVIPVENALESFVKQFATDFGQQALAQAAALAPAVISGETSIKDAASTLGGQLTTDAVTDAEKDGTVALNALRVQIEAQKATPAIAKENADSPDKNQSGVTD